MVNCYQEVGHMTLGKKIAELRKLHHYSQESLAEQMNVSRQTISKWETDLSVPDIERIIKLSEIFHVSLNELLQINQEKAMNHEELQAIVNQMLIIQNNYEQEVIQRKKQNTHILFIGVVVFIILCFMIGIIFYQLYYTKVQIDLLTNDISYSINDIHDSIQNSIHSEASLLSDFTYEISEVDFQKNRVKISLNVILKSVGKQTQVQFIVVDAKAKQHILKTQYKDGKYEYRGYIPTCHINQLYVHLEDNYQKQSQCIEDFCFNFEDGYYIDFNYTFLPIDVNYDRGYNLTVVTLKQKKKDYAEDIQYLRNQKQIDNHEEITIIDNDLYIQKIDYHIFYKDKEIKKGLLVNQFKEKMYQAEIPIDIAHIGNNQLIKVIVDVYDDKGNKYSIYDHSISRTRGMIGMSSIESQNELTLSE